MLGEEFQVSPDTDSPHGSPSVAPLAGGGFVTLWQGRGAGGSDSSGTSIQGQRFADDGTAVGQEFQVNSFTTGDQLAISFGDGPD